MLAYVGGCNGLTRTEPSWWCWCPCKRFGPREKRTVRVGEVPTVVGLESWNVSKPGSHRWLWRQLWCVVVHWMRRGRLESQGEEMPPTRTANRSSRHKCRITRTRSWGSHYSAAGDRRRTTATLPCPEPISGTERSLGSASRTLTYPGLGCAGTTSSAAISGEPTYPGVTCERPCSRVASSPRRSSRSDLRQSFFEGLRLRRGGRPGRGGGGGRGCRRVRAELP